MDPGPELGLDLRLDPGLDLGLDLGLDPGSVLGVDLGQNIVMGSRSWIRIRIPKRMPNGI